VLFRSGWLVNRDIICESHLKCAKCFVRENDSCEARIFVIQERNVSFPSNVSREATASVV